MIPEVHSGSRVKRGLKGLECRGQAGGPAPPVVQGEGSACSRILSRWQQVSSRALREEGGDSHERQTALGALGREEGPADGCSGRHRWGCRAQGERELSQKVLLVSLERRPSVNVSSDKAGTCLLPSVLLPDVLS